MPECNANETDVCRQILTAYKAVYPGDPRDPKILTAKPGECIGTFFFDPPEGSPVRRAAFCGYPADWRSTPQQPPGECFLAGGADEDQALQNLLLCLKEVNQ